MLPNKPYRKPIVRCLLCGGTDGGSRGATEEYTIEEHTFNAHPACKQRVPNDFIVWFIETTTAMKRGEKRK